MKILFFVISLTSTLFSCGKDFYGTYNTNYSKDRSAFFQIKLNIDNTVEKTETHTIGDFARGRFVINDRRISCFFDSSRNKFPPDTLTFRLKGKKLYFAGKVVLNKKAYLMKE